MHDGCILGDLAGVKHCSPLGAEGYGLAIDFISILAVVQHVAAEDL